MKKILCILSLLALCIAARAQIITATLTITNTPSTGNSLTVKGSTFYWTNGTPIGSYMMLITNTPGNDATNLYTVTSAVLPSLGVQVQNPSSNVVTFLGINLSASIGGSGWAGLVLTTNGTTPATQMVAPINIYPAAMATNAESQFVLDIGTYSTNAIDQNSTAASLLVGLTNTQTFGNKTITNSSLNGSTVSNSVITNATGISGTVFHLTNGNWINPSFTNGQNFGNPFRSPGTGTGSEQFGSGASATADYSVAFGDVAIAAGFASSAYGNGATANYVNSAAFGKDAIANAPFAVTLSGDAEGTNSVALGGGSQTSSTHTSSTALGYNSATTAAHQVMIGTSSEFAQFPGGVLFTGPETNLTTAGTNTFAGTLVVPASSNSSLVNSNNVLTVSANSYLQLSGPSGAFFVAAINGGIDGRVITLENSTGQTMVIGNQSGYDTSTTTNRILTGYSADRQFTNNPGVVTLRYDGTAQRWKITSVN